jgi:hypothetical protein
MKIFGSISSISVQYGENEEQLNSNNEKSEQGAGEKTKVKQAK